MRIVLNLPDDILCGFLNGVKMGCSGLELFSYQLGSDDFTNGNEITLPREKE